MRVSSISVRPSWLGGLVVALGLVSAPGCGCTTGKEYQPKAFAVEGTLRYKDGTDANDLGGGTLELESSTKTVIQIPIAMDGTVNRDEKLPTGKYRARIVPPPPKPDGEFELEAKFKQFDTSGLTVTIGDENPQQINLTLTRTQRANRS